MPILNGKAYWASVVTPNTTFDEDGVYSVDIAVDSDNKKLAEAEGLSIKNKGDDRGDFVTIKRKAKRKDGNPNKAPETFQALFQTIKSTAAAEVWLAVLWRDPEKETRKGQPTNNIPYSIHVKSLQRPSNKTAALEGRERLMIIPDQSRII